MFTSTVHNISHRKAKDVACSKNTPIYDSYQEIAPFIVPLSKRLNQGNRYNVDNADGNHRTDGTE
jgi:hypothetical protein